MTAKIGDYNLITDLFLFRAEYQGSNQMEVLSENRPAVNIPFNQDELLWLFNSVQEEKHRLMHSHTKPSERPPLSEGRKENINTLWLLQAKIGGYLKPKRDPGPPPNF